MFALALRDIKMLQFLPSKVKVTEYSFRYDTVRWQMSKSTKDSYAFCASSYRFRENVDLQKVGQGHRVKLSQ